MNKLRTGIILSIILCSFFSACTNGQDTGTSAVLQPNDFAPDGTTQVFIPSLNGNKISIRIKKPEGHGPFPVLIGVAGGDEYYAFSTGLQNSLIEAGIAAVDFAPQGRGESEGDDNFHGTVHQDDLKAITDFLAQLPLVQEDNIGILSWSYGVVLATGALARYPDMAVSFLIDWEGPSCPGKDFQRGLENNEAWVYEIIRYLNNGQDMTEEQLRFLVLHGGSIYDDEYWYERDASRFAADLPCPYLRVQFEHDHAQEIYKYHMMSIVNAAAGSGQWTRVNNNPPNTIYSDDNLSKYFFHEYNENELPQTMSMDSAYVDSVLMGYIEEMFFSKPYNNQSSSNQNEQNDTYAAGLENTGLTQSLFLWRLCDPRKIRLSVRNRW